MASRRRKRIELRGLGASPGLVLGPVYRLAWHEAQVPEAPVAPGKVGAEIRRFRRALRGAREEIRELGERLGSEPDDAGRQILHSHLMILQDRELMREIIEAIKAERMNAAHVVRRAFLAKAHYLESLPSEVFRARAADIRDVKGRLLGQLLGMQRPSLHDLPARAVVVASEMTPSDTAALQPEEVGALVTERGTLTSHVTIMARSRGVPAVVGVGARLGELAAGELVLVDGGRGLVIVAPNREDVRRYERRLDRDRRLAELYQAQQAQLVETRDGKRVPVLANIERPEDASLARRMGAEGVGLYRTEFFLMDAPVFPSEERQRRAYRAVTEAFEGRPVTIRTLDLGGDKYAGLMGIPREANPFLGLRGIRFCLEHPEVLLTQARALLSAATHGPVRILLPMIGEVGQLRRSRALIEQARAQLAAAGQPTPEEVAVGVMIEVPSAVWMSAELAREADYFSIGSNDLVQYVLAADRGNAGLARLYEPLEPAVLRAIEATVRSAHAARIPAGSCGELSGELPGLLLLVGLGVDELSVAPFLVPRVKAILSQVSAHDLERLAARCCAAATAGEVRTILREDLGADPHFHLEEQDGKLLCHWDPEAANRGTHPPKEPE